MPEFTSLKSLLKKIKMPDAGTINALKTGRSRKFLIGAVILLVIAFLFIGATQQVPDDTEQPPAESVTTSQQDGMTTDGTTIQAATSSGGIPLLYFVSGGLHGQQLMAYTNQTPTDEWTQNKTSTPLNATGQWPNGYLATINGEIVDWRTGQTFSPIVNSQTSHGAVGPDGLMAYVQHSEDRDVLVVSDGSNFSAHRIIGLHFSPEGDLVFSAQLTADVPYAVYFWDAGWGTTARQEPVAIPATNGDQILPSISPDGRTIVFSGNSADDQGCWKLWTFENETFSLQPPQPEIVYADCGAIDPEWGPVTDQYEGGPIAFTRCQNIAADFTCDGGVIALLDLERRQVTDLVEGQMPTWAWLDRQVVSSDNSQDKLGTGTLDTDTSFINLLLEDEPPLEPNTAIEPTNDGDEYVVVTWNGELNCHRGYSPEEWAAPYTTSLVNNERLKVVSRGSAPSSWTNTQTGVASSGAIEVELADGSTCVVRDNCVAPSE